MTSFGYHDPEGEGDILLLHTDGLTEHHQRGESYFPGRLEQKLRDVKFLCPIRLGPAVQSGTGVKR